MKKIVVSACLIGQNCKYSGGNNLNQRVMKFLEGKEIIPVCPEVLGGLETPRPCAEIVNGRVTDQNGRDVDEAYYKGAQAVLQKLKGEEIELAVLQSRSPSCGVKQIYDGSFSGKLIFGQGVLAKALKEAGYRVLDAEDLEV